ncbi:hypothetical protein FHS43_000768 [Streptosporangium becharense]|uniref:Uncharacterized protein n=1 Tax=Streptosporangium becharense TaxID=1816182 RepID=A0A7W9MGG3_9ACTN|nr:hypothetical protein [Streptosporangium becharense]MBB2909522.1 hypothetical protein [Streptosporangium becharense]MBB5819521.1 hypothetical protein [Streptosporangium becharense]
MHTTIGAGFGTEHDRPLPALVPPAVVESGRTGGLRVTDQVYRGTRFVGRFASSGLAGFKVFGSGPGVRVRVLLSLDNKAITHWRRNVEGREEASRLPRLIQIRSQGRLRQCVLLDSRSARRRPRATVEFELTADELPRDGLLCVEAVDATEWYGTSPRLTGAVYGRVAPSSVTGVRIDRVEFEPVSRSAAGRFTGVLDATTGEEVSLVSLGGVPYGRKAGARRLDSGLIVVNPMPPSAEPGRIGLCLGLRVAGPPKGGGPARPRVRRTRLGRLRLRVWRVRRAVHTRIRGVLNRLTAAGHALAARIRPVAVPEPLVLSMEDGRAIPVSFTPQGRRDARLDFLAPLTAPALVVLPAAPRLPRRMRLSLVSVARLPW